MNNAAVIAHRGKSVTVDMADRYGMEAAAFEATVRATCIKPDKNGRVASREEFAAFLLVAKQYNLNPLTKEIYAFASKGGGVVPIVSIDGWANLINSHPQFDGMEFDDAIHEKGGLTSITCRMFRKDRGHAISVTEYMAECKRDTEVWKQWPRRMLRHKAMIQAARYAFSFAGIYDEDEGERIVNAAPVAPTPPAPPPAAIASPVVASPPSAALEPVTGELLAQGDEFDFDAFRAKLRAAKSDEEANAIYSVDVSNRVPMLRDDELDECDAILREETERFYKAED